MNILPFALAPIVAVAAAQADASDGPDVAVRVDHTGLLSEQSAMAAEDSGFFVQEATQQALREHGATVVERSDAPSIVVTLGWVHFMKSIYRVEIATQRPGEEPQVLGEFECACGTNGELTAFVAKKVPDALAQLAEAGEDPVQGEPESSTPNAADDPSGKDPTGEDPTPQQPAGPRRAPLGPLGKAGIGTLAGGAVGLVAGGIVFAQGRREDEGPTGIDVTGRDFTTPGVAVMVTGGVLAVTGVALLIVDRARAPRAKEQHVRLRWSASPAGLAVRW